MAKRVSFKFGSFLLKMVKIWSIVFPPRISYRRLSRLIGALLRYVGLSLRIWLVPTAALRLRPARVAYGMDAERPH